MTKEEIEDEYIDWFFLAGDDVQALEGQGFRHAFFIMGPGVDLSELGAHALVTDEFPHGDIVFFKKLVKPQLWEEMGIWPISIDTKSAANVAIILHQAEGDDAIEIYSERSKWAAAIHPCARPGCEWQGSKFDKYGPFGHVEADSVEEALKQLFEHASDWKYQPGAVDATVTELGQFRHPLHPNPSIDKELLGHEDSYLVYNQAAQDLTRAQWNRLDNDLREHVWQATMSVAENERSYGGADQEKAQDLADKFYDWGLRR